MKKIPMRKCVVSGERYPKKDLLRIVKTPEGEIKIDVSGKMNGRGAYLKLDKQTIELEKKKGSLSKALEVSIPEAIYDEILKLLCE